ncbi:MAG: DUF86 domain-containing protein [Candidatus Omnitrophica bacterium]|nr:DUF86 domain-containing protein [Candidatus Omnitrophota bacterium]
MKNDKIYLRHIDDAITHIENFIRAVDANSFSRNALVYSAVIRQLEIIGEAVKNLSVDFRKAHKQIPWKDISGLRDKLIHQYFGVDNLLVWKICKKELPELKRFVQNILK